MQAQSEVKGGSGSGPTVKNRGASQDNAEESRKAEVSDENAGRRGEGQKRKKQMERQEEGGRGGLSKSQ